MRQGLNKNNKSVKKNKNFTFDKNGNAVCHFCINTIDDIDYTEAEMLRRFMSAYARILPRRITGTCAKHQRRVANAIKRARIVALLPFVV
jgi:small subunit ribosomal protein S18